MRILIAGATGAIGRPLVRCLKQNGHAAFALARSSESSRVVAAMGAEPLISDVLDAASVKAAVARVRPDAIFSRGHWSGYPQLDPIESDSNGTWRAVRTVAAFAWISCTFVRARCVAEDALHSTQ